MSLEKRYNPQEVEPRLQAFWQANGLYHFHPEEEGPVFSIDTPPPTVSGHLHLGHVYSYTHVDLIARFWRMRGRRVFYPMGFDDNGLPTERLVEKRMGVKAAQIGRQAFIEKCLQLSAEAVKDYRALWQRLGLSIDWRHSYRTMDDYSRRTSQFSFLELYRRDLAYRGEAPAIWCPECRTSIAQAEVNDLERESEFVTLKFDILPKGRFHGEEGYHPAFLAIATTRPELLPACVAVFVHPQDPRYRGLAGQQARVPLFGQTVPILEDPGADPEKGTGAVMCCTFGDTADVDWWRAHRLPLIEAIDREGRMTPAAGVLSGLTIEAARKQVKGILVESGLMLGRQPTHQIVRVHERCDTPVEYRLVRQWFIRVLDFKDRLLEAGERVNWHPASMQARYQAWVENLNWDWCISRQRYFGVPFPVWYCKRCGETILAEAAQLPVDPMETRPARPCECGSTEFSPEEDVFDTWATSSMSPQIVGRWLEDAGSSPENGAGARLFDQVFPFSLRPQGHEIIRTWAFYTITKSRFHFQALPWKDVLLSGWGLAGEGQGKISKSRGGGPLPPMEMIQRYSADAVRYWAASTGPGRDSVISEEKIGIGARLVNKLWNVARFCEPFLDGQSPADGQSLDAGQTMAASQAMAAFTPADRWILSRLQRLVRRVTALMEGYEYAAAKSEIEMFFWTELADNYLEMCKQRLYEERSPGHTGARFTLGRVLPALIELLSPFLPHVTEEIYQGLFAARQIRASGAPASVHTAPWPEPDPAFQDEAAEAVGRALVEIATAVRRYKSEHNLALGTELDRLQLCFGQPELRQSLLEAEADLKSITRARQIELAGGPAPEDGSIGVTVFR